MYRGSVTSGHTMTFTQIAGLPFSDVQTLTADPVASGTVYAANNTSVYRTSNAGATWSALSTLSSTIDPVTRIQIDAKNHAIGYVTCDGSLSVNSSGTRSPWKSTNLTAASSQVSAAPANVGMDAQSGRLLQQHPSRPGTLAVVSDSLFESTDGATTWIDLPAQNGSSVSLQPWAWAGAGYDAAGTLYASNASSVVRATASAPLAQVASGRSFNSFGVSPVLTGTFFGVQSVDWGLYRCTDPCAAWTRIPLPAGLYPLGGIAFARAAGAAGQPPIYEYGQGGMSRSLDGGLTFTALPSFSGSHIHYLAVDPLDGDRIVFSLLSGGLYMSNDGGVTYTNIGASFPAGTYGMAAIDSRSSPATIYFSPDAIPGGTHTFYRTSNDGATWTQAGSGLDGASFIAIWPDVQSAGQIIYAGSWTRGVFKTTTGGL
jgi:hypothetical protein